MIRYELPYPPTVNNLFFNKTKGRAPTAAYKAWQKAAGEAITTQGRKHLHGFYSLSALVVKPDKRKRDISNLIKAIEDLLVSMQVVDDDSLCQRVSIQWVSSGAECVVLIQQAEEAMAA